VTQVDGVDPNVSLDTAPAVELTRRGAGVVATFLALVIVSVVSGSRSLVPVLAGVGAVLLLAPVAAWRRGHRTLSPPMRVHLRAQPSLVEVGGASTLEVTVVHPGSALLPPVALENPAPRWRLTHRPSDRTPPPASAKRPWGFTLAPSPSALVSLPSSRADGTGSIAGRTTLAPVPTGRRGIVRLPPLRVWTHDPLGLFAVAVGATRPLSVAVHPAARPTSNAPRPIGAASGSPDIVAAAPSPASGWGDFSDLRPYVPGDRLHLVDWPALARYDRLMVRRFDPESGAAVRLVLDDRAGVHRRADFERLLATLVGLVDAALADGHPVEVATVSGATFDVAPNDEGRSSFLRRSASLLPRPGSRPPNASLGLDGTLVTTESGLRRLGAGAVSPEHVVVA